ncbi:Golgi apparatus membrane protein tvp38 [Aspergillus japonicus CBS 114.51]|uniref:Golgi apparatus membrane protein TVP38 n=2 Tax=Aspergillus TaxID=5052 RepID=A0A2V5IFC4_ASPV1|nr:Golgi apparatus membrane protein tvp38 [Aspergillus japonicus CBS 114.51]PYI18356.1 Golgi apparatus membrane protein tvp38 [Aspergillus violaceofuscus CBS 115571]RAH87041.1 Golgi apparatus membrane protein tvp38 [Aspergillus japonicus CBS 114.51]
MPADYTSTARALSVSPTSPEAFSPSDEDIFPPWSQRASAQRNSPGTAGRKPTTFREQAIDRATQMSRRIRTAWRKMTFWQRVGAVGAFILANMLGLAFLFFTGKVFIWIRPVAAQWEKSRLAFFILWLCVFFVSFPPLVGWSTFGTVSGYLFGVWKGWLLYASATVLGSTVSFIVSRTVLSKFVHRLIERDKRFAALSLTLKYDGLKLLCMIRLCPLPYSVCNGAVSTFPTVHPLMYGLATAIVSPKLLVPAFIGSRLRILSENNEKMSAGSKAVNICSIIFTIAIGVFTGLYIYKRTLARAKELEAKEREDIRRTLQADHAAHRSHQAFSEDPDVDRAARTLARDEEEQIGFTDLDDDHVELAIDDESGSETLSGHGKSSRYRDEFTDNDSDAFRDEDGAHEETYTLHTHVRRD